MRTASHFLSFLVAIVVLCGCTGSIASSSTNTRNGNPPEIAAKLNQKFSIRYARRVRIPSEDLEIQFTDVVADSRCPSQTQCIVAGQVEILLHLSRGDRDLGNINLVRQVGRENAATATLDGYSIELVEVQPYPKTPKPIELSDYTVILNLSGSPSSR